MNFSNFLSIIYNSYITFIYLPIFSIFKQVEEEIPNNHSNIIFLLTFYQLQFWLHTYNVDSSLNTCRYNTNDEDKNLECVKM